MAEPTTRARPKRGKRGDFTDWFLLARVDGDEDAVRRLWLNGRNLDGSLMAAFGLNGRVALGKAHGKQTSEQRLAMARVLERAARVLRRTAQ